MQITEDDAWRVFHFECDAPGGPAHGLQARVLAPKRRHGSAEVEFQTQGSLTDTELDIITAAMRAANAFVNKVVNLRHHSPLAQVLLLVCGISQQARNFVKCEFALSWCFCALRSAFRECFCFFVMTGQHACECQVWDCSHVWKEEAEYESSGRTVQEQGYNRVDVWESEMNEVREGVAGLFRELERSFSFGIGMLPGIERHMAREMQRIFDTG